MAHVARISRLRVCRAPSSCGGLWASGWICKATFSLRQPGFSARVLLSSKGHGRIANYATLLLGLRVVSGINAIRRRGVALATVFSLLLFFLSFFFPPFFIPVFPPTFPPRPFACFVRGFFVHAS